MIRGKEKLEVYDIGPGWEINTQTASPKNVKEMNKVKERLITCLDVLTNEQLRDISSDDYFADKAGNILTERRGE